MKDINFEWKQIEGGQFYFQWVKGGGADQNFIRVREGGPEFFLSPVEVGGPAFFPIAKGGTRIYSHGQRGDQNFLRIRGPGLGGQKKRWPAITNRHTPSQ